MRPFSHHAPSPAVAIVPRAVKTAPSSHPRMVSLLSHQRIAGEAPSEDCWAAHSNVETRSQRLTRLQSPASRPPTRRRRCQCSLRQGCKQTQAPKWKCHMAAIMRDLMAGNPLPSMAKQRTALTQLCVARVAASLATSRSAPWHRLVCHQGRPSLTGARRVPLAQTCQHPRVQGICRNSSMTSRWSDCRWRTLVIDGNAQLEEEKYSTHN